MTAEKPDADRLVVRRVIPASRDAVFAAWTDPESIKHWMCPGDIIEAEAHLDPRPGGRFRILMKMPGRAVDHTGEYLVVERPSKLVFTWISVNTGNRPSLVTVELFERGADACELVLTHERLPDPEQVRRHSAGWTQITEKLGRHFAGPPA